MAMRSSVQPQVQIPDCVLLRQIMKFMAQLSFIGYKGDKGE
jgi:hypothetical protein